MRLSQIARQIQPIIFAMIVFLIPTNLFMKFFVPTAFVHGLLVDYLLPKLYLSDLFVLALIGAWCIDLDWTKMNRSLSSHAFLAAVLFLFFAINLVAVFPSGQILATIWFEIKIIELWILGAWMLTNKTVLRSATTFIAATCAVMFQFVIAMYQYVTQRSIFGFWFFGEPTLSGDPTIAKSQYSSVVKILPYGTTAHPNILAGAVVMLSLFCLMLAAQEKKPSWRWVVSLLLIVSVLTVLLTESLTAGAALVVGLLMFLGYTLAPNLEKLWQRMSAATSIVLIIAIPTLLWILPSQRSSILRRNQLEHIAVSMFAAHPIAGVGLNQFTAVMSGFGNVSANLRFLQPVHNVPLLWLSETGVVGCLFVGLLAYIAHKKYSANFFAFGILGLPYLIILSLDHYALSVQSGLLLSTILVATMLEKKSQLHR